MRRTGGLWGRWLGRPAAIAAALLAVAAIPALAARPEAGCWGSCGGPVAGGAFFRVQNSHVEGFTTRNMACLGTYRGTHEWISVQKKLPITSAGRFSFKGEAVRGGPGTKIPVSLNGRFVSATKAKGTLTVSSKNCKPYQFTVRRLGG